MKKKTFKKSIMILFISCSIAVPGCLNFQSRWSTGGLGIQLAQVEDGVIIKDIAPTFDNESAALRTGDYIVMVDGQNVSQLEKEEILDAISGPVGSNVSVTVLRKGKLVTLEIERIIQKNAERKTLYSVARPTAVETEPSKAAADATGNTEEAADATPAEEVSEASAAGTDEESAGEGTAASDSPAVDTDEAATTTTTDSPQQPTSAADTDA